MKYSVLVCVVFAFAACHLSEVATTPLPPPRTYEDSDGDSESQEDLHLKKISLPKNKIRTKRGIPCPKLEDTDCEWEMNPPCGCDPCDAVRHANEARMLRKQHRKIVTEMKINRLKRKLHTAVCPSCALAYERGLEHKPCNKPHVDITVVVPNGNQQGISEVPVPIVEYPSLPPPRQTYSQVVQTGSHVVTSGPIYDEPMVPQYGPMVPEPQYGPMVPEPQYGPMVPEPQYGPMVPEPQYGPMVPEPQYGPMVPRPQYAAMVPEAQFEPMVPEPQRFEGFGPAVPWMRSASDTEERKGPTEEVIATEQDTKRIIQKSEGLLTIFVEHQNTTTEEPIDSEDAWPYKNATYYAVEAEAPRLPSLTDTTTEAPAPPYDSGEAVIFNYTRSPGTYDSGEAVIFNYTGSPRTYDSGEAVPFNDTGSPRAYDSGEAVPFNYTGPPQAGRYARDETSLRAPPTDEVLWQTAYLAASKAVASALNKSYQIDTLKSSDSSVVKRNCTGSECMAVCLESGCLQNEVRHKRDTDTTAGMPFASALLTGLVSAIIGV